MLVLLKLGGSLITDKDTPHTARRDVIARLAREIAATRSRIPDLQIVLGHGSGSFGHVPAAHYGTRKGVYTPDQWLGFAEVWKEARSLNELVIAEFIQAGLPVIAFPPSAAIHAMAGKVLTWDLGPLRSALEHGLVPVVFGDVVFDADWGGTILSTEDLFSHLSRHLHPDRILLAGIEPGVWADYPQCNQLLTELTSKSFSGISHNISGSASLDVTGGMLEKVQSMLALIERQSNLRVFIFSGTQPGALERALSGENPGTTLRE